MEISSLFTDHMVLQNQKATPIWGWAKSGDEISVKFNPGKSCKNKKQTKTTITGKNGKWCVSLDPMSISTISAELVVQSKSGEKLNVTDILIGEVWLASGQSNMEWIVQNSLNAEKETESAKWPQIRMFSVPRYTDDKPVKNVKAKWTVCSPETVGKFSAVGYFFAKEIHKAQKTPVGILNTSWGGSRVETWISKNGLLSEASTRKETLDYIKDFNKVDRKIIQANRDEFMADQIAWLRKRVVADPGNKAYGKGWAKPTFDDSKWSEMTIPNVWQAGGIPENGVVWFRKKVHIPKNWAGKDLQITLGACDKHDVTYFNNEKIGSIGWELYDPWNVTRKYTIPGHLVIAGENLITVRVYSYRNGGGLTGPGDEMSINLLGDNQSKSINIAGQWKMKMEHNFGVIKSTNIEPGNNQNAPYTLYNSLLHPLIPYAIKGFIWYQGESNAGVAQTYHNTFSRMIREWRAVWGGTNLPFIFVQLANYTSSGTWPLLREAQLKTLNEPNTGMAVTIDVGDKTDIHPKNKQAVGKRLALQALHLAYHKKIDYSGPLYRNYIQESSKIQIWFNHDMGLTSSDNGPIKGFTIAGQDQVFHPAKVSIEADSVFVSSPKVKEPIAVRYAWDDYPTCNLINKAGLPASPFRTDNWT
jgi:sialate O-acetylesterase